MHLDPAAKPPDSKMAAVLVNYLARAFGNVLKKDFQKDAVEE